MQLYMMWCEINIFNILLASPLNKSKYELSSGSVFLIKLIPLFCSFIWIISEMNLLRKLGSESRINVISIECIVVIDYIFRNNWMFCLIQFCIAYMFFKSRSQLSLRLSYIWGITIIICNFVDNITITKALIYIFMPFDEVKFVNDSIAYDNIRFFYCWCSCFRYVMYGMTKLFFVFLDASSSSRVSPLSSDVTFNFSLKSDFPFSIEDFPFWAWDWFDRKWIWERVFVV